MSAPSSTARRRTDRKLVAQATLASVSPKDRPNVMALR
ncbi:hypothetical protein HNR02_001368 [Amycolatopsis endophytica]|uniref:Uncharacterized protein n=1 Tax=Amycolatopsis endophytica TaxID=860233 RepID=A0A853AZJ8_9PSEU|nr:hypothetical protein [Amycolatopsis endophytica]